MINSTRMLHARITVAIFAQIIAMALVVLSPYTPWAAALPTSIREWFNESTQMATNGMMISLEFAVLSQVFGRLRAVRWRSRALQTVCRLSTLAFIASTGSLTLLTLEPKVPALPSYIFSITDIADVMLGIVYAGLFGSFLLFIVGLADLDTL